MPKTIKNVFELISSPRNIYGAYLNARQDKRYKKDVLKFSANLVDNLYRVRQRILAGDFQPGPYFEFYVYEPKCRLIMAQPFEDRVAQWAFCQVLNPLLEKGYITDSYASIRGRGQIRAVNRLHYWLRIVDKKNNTPCYPMEKVLQTLADAGWVCTEEKELAKFEKPGRKRPVLLNISRAMLSPNGLRELEQRARVTFPDAPEVEKWYSLKLDISKFYYRVSHEVLLRELERKISDQHVLAWARANLCNNNINFGLPPGKKPEEVPRDQRIPGRGMPVGALFSQMFSNFYLNPMDQFAKRRLGIQYYLRFADDTIILSNNKQQLHEWKETLGGFLNEELQLDLNEKVCIRPITLGIDFCGFKVWSNHIKMRKSTALRMKRNLKRVMDEYAAGEMDLPQAKEVVSSYMDLLSRCDSYELRKAIFGEYSVTEWTEGWFVLKHNSAKIEEHGE